MKTLVTTVILFLTFGSLLALLSENEELFFTEHFGDELRVKRDTGLPSSRSGNTCNGTAEDCCSGYYGPRCLGCGTLLTCADDVINKQQCSSMNAAKAFCTESACTATPPDAICLTESKFRCTTVGFFPNPDNCTKYSYCVSQGVNGSYSFECPPNHVYQSSSGSCKPKTSSVDCKVVSCAGNSNKYQVWAADKAVLVYCADTIDLKETILFKCPDPQNMEYDADTLQCKFTCKVEGRFPDIDDCTQYFDCFKNGTALQARRTACPQHFKFDRTIQMCVFGTCQP